ncbi:MAG: N-acetylneuraminic acid mutarotase [Candidatus Pelagisphaera sp.]
MHSFPYSSAYQRMRAFPLLSMNRFKRTIQFVPQLKSGLGSLFLMMLLVPADLVWSVPLELTYQGRVYLADVPFEGVGSFKFALLDEDGASVWSNDDSSVDGSEPTAGVALSVNRGSYAIRLGDESTSGMGPISSSVFDADALFLRIWFQAGANPYVLLVPDRALGSVAFSIKAASADYATIAGTVETLPEISATDITSGTISDNRIGSSIARASDLEAQVASLQSQITTLSLQGGTVPAGSLVIASALSDDPDLLANGYRRFTTVRSDGWIDTANEGQPSARNGHSLVWTGSGLIVWGGAIAASVFANTGAIYHPSIDDWSELSSVDAPEARAGHSAVWADGGMLIWGGFSNSGYLADGKRFDPDTQLWTPISPINAPVKRTDHASIWTGDLLVIWGGVNGSGLLADGGIYDPNTDTWTALALSNAPSARKNAEAVWTGDRIILFGGEGIAGSLGDGAQLLFTGNTPDAWQALSGTNAPSARNGHSLTWTGDGAILFGGENGGSFRDDGAIYDPVAASWTALSSADAPTARSGHAAVWTGDELLVIGGLTGTGATAQSSAYDPASELWRGLESGSGLIARSAARAVWANGETFVFGGIDGSTRLSNLKRIEPSPALYLYRAP